MMQHPKVATALICHECGAAFERYLPSCYVREHYFCGATCRNHHLTREHRRVYSPRYCLRCGLQLEVGVYKTCLACREKSREAPRPPRPSRAGTYVTWTPERVAYLRTHYPQEGRKAVAAALGISPSAVAGKASKLGVTLDNAVYCRLVHSAAREYMIARNPMRTEGAKAKVRQWREDHPEEVERIQLAVAEGHARLDREKPSGLERRLREMLTALDVEFEPSALIKPKFVVDIRIGNLIIQADGDYWHGHPRFTAPTERQLAQQRRDAAQDAYLRSCGYTVVHIWESDLGESGLRTILEENGVIAPA